MRLLFLLILAELFFVAIAMACSGDCVADDRLYQLERHWEGYSPFIYKDAAGHETIGFGHLIKPGEHFNLPLMGEDAEALLESDNVQFEQAVDKMVTTYVKTGTYDSLVDFSFNLGSGTLEHSTLLKSINSDKGCIKEDFTMYDKIHVNGIPRVLQGLLNRRLSEFNLCQEPY